MSTYRARDIMKRDVMTVPEDMTVRELATFLIENQISGAPVTNKRGRIVGVVSMRDIVGVDVDRPDSVSGSRNRPEFYDMSWDNMNLIDEVPQMHIERQGMLVGDVMNSAVYKVHPDAPVRDIAQTMLQAKIHRVMVMNGGDRLEGIVTTMDLLPLI
ncbi:MAG TPA: CBS domain-containing protein [Bdellovibrionota bacterium]|nr:CBS domain-containing protein [Bdellovibrionota bacterium]